MESISPSDLALEILNDCLRGSAPPTDLLDALLRSAERPEGSRALFNIVVERLGDLFEPALCDAYTNLFSRAIEFVYPELPSEDLVERYRRIRMPRRFTGDLDRVHDVFVLSRITLGADVAVTSVALDAAKRRFPKARIHFVGPRKSWELFAADPRLSHANVDYGRTATLPGRLAVWPELKSLLDRPGAIVIDPDSRLTQLGLLPVCAEENYYFFESRGYGGYGLESITELTSRWLAETFDAPDARPYIATPCEPVPADVTISLGVGENPAKRVADPFEQELLRAVAATGVRILIDKGAGGEEQQRVERAIAAAGGRIETHHGAFAPFAASIAASRLYIGYDSAGQHVAAASKTPLVTVFAGAVSDRMFARWRPTGAGPIQIIRVTEQPPERILAEALKAISRLST